jgi:hypothetical protein
VSFDFNRNPFCVTIAQVHADPSLGTIVQFVGEVREEDYDTESACTKVFEILHELGIDKHHVRVFGDPSGKNLSTKSNVSDYDIITRRFTRQYANRFVKSWVRLHRHVLEGVHAVNGALLSADGSVRVYVSPRCEWLVRDFEVVVFKPGTREIHKEGEYRPYTHLSDAARYLIEQILPLKKASGGRIMV